MTRVIHTRNTPHDRRLRAAATGALTLATLAGLPMTVAAQMQTQQHKTQKQSAASVEQASDKTRSHRFHRADAILDTDVVNPNGETLGDVTDLILDRGSGRITHVIFRSGGVLGFGGELLAIDYDRFDIGAGRDALTLSMTPEQLERTPGFDPEQWDQLGAVSWSARAERWWSGSEAAQDQDPYAPSARGDKPTKVKGEVIGVDRVEVANGEEWAIVNVRAEDGKAHSIVLGPTWYVLGGAAAPMRGEPISASVHKVERDARGDWVANRATIDGVDLPLRSDDERPAWVNAHDFGWDEAGLTDYERDDDDRARGGYNEDAARDRTNRAIRPGERDEMTDDSWEPSRSARAFKYLRVTDLIGAPVATRDNNQAEVHDAIIERQSGRVALLAIDPNQNFLGIGDEIRLAPWSVASIKRDGSVRLDADLDTLRQSDTLPDDVSALNTRDRLKPIYAVYEVDMMVFRPAGERRSISADAMSQYRSPNATASSRKLIEAVKDAKRSTIQGECRGMIRVTPPGSAERFKALRVMTDEGMRTVALAPVWWADRQTVPFEKGERVRVTAHEVEIDGRTMLIARSVNAGVDEMTLWKGDKPRWIH